MTRAHAPQDEIYGPLTIPAFCWPVIDSPEFQRLRYIEQLGCVNLVYPSATHTRFEHCLGVAHLASVFMAHIVSVQPDLEIDPLWTKAVVLSALCHDLGHGPWSHCFDAIAAEYSSEWNHEDMGCSILRYVIEKRHIDIETEVVDAACCFISGLEYSGYPKWLSRIVANRDCDIDLDKFDYLARDMNRSLASCRFEYDRLIFHCRVVEGQLAWKMSEIPTIERMFFNRNDMHNRVYQHRVIQAFRAMTVDMLRAADPYLDVETRLDDPETFCELDSRIMYLIERGQCGEEAKKIANDISRRRVYKCIGEVRVKPHNTEGMSYSQLPNAKIGDDIAAIGGLDVEKIRVTKMQFRYGLTKNAHPLLSVAFWKPGLNEVVRLTEEDISCIVPAHFRETGMRVFVTDPDMEPSARVAFEKWKEINHFK